MKPVSPRQQRGAVTLMGALFLIIVIIVLLNSVQRMAASDITDSALHNDSVEALFIAESGLERASWRYANGTACTALAGDSANTGRGNFQVISAAPSGSLCVVRVRGNVTTTTAANTVSRTIDGSLTAGGSAGNSWAAGKDDGGELLLNWDGSNWNRSGPYTGIPDKDVNGIHCVAADDCWAVGEDKDGELIIHWDGSSWSRSGPYGSIPNKRLYSVHCIAANDCWAVGEDSGGELIIHWDGSSWSRSGPYGSIPNKNLNSVHCIASNDCWAVGDDSGGELIIHWNGSNWSRSGPYGNIPNKKLYSVHCVAANDCWAVGEKSGYETIIHWDGSTWTREGNISGLSNDHLNSVYMVSATEGYLVGDDGNTATWNGTSWTGQSSPSDKDLYAVTATVSSGGGSVSLAQWTEVIQ